MTLPHQCWSWESLRLDPRATESPLTVTLSEASEKDLKAHPKVTLPTECVAQIKGAPSNFKVRIKGMCRQPASSNKTTLSPTKPRLVTVPLSVNLWGSNTFKLAQGVKWKNFS